MEKVKILLFAKWIATCYADTHMDDKGRTENDMDFNSKNAICVLNREKGEWWKERLEHFEKVVYPNYVKNGSALSFEKLLFEGKAVENCRHYDCYQGKHKCIRTTKTIKCEGVCDKYDDIR